MITLLVLGCSGIPALGGPPPEPPGPAISAFVLMGERCVWQRIDLPTPSRPDPRPRALATFDGDCVGARVAFAPDRTRALVWFDPTTVERAGYHADGAPTPRWPDEPEAAPTGGRMYEVDLDAGSVVAVPLLEGAQYIGFERGGPLGFTVRDLTEEEQSSGVAVVAGLAIPVPARGEGIRAVATTWALRNGSWSWVENGATSTKWDYAMEWRGLAASHDLGPTSTHKLVDAVQTTDVAPAYNAALDRARPSVNSDGWVALSEAPSVFVYRIVAEFTYQTGSVRFAGPGPGEVSLPVDLGFTGGELAWSTVQGHWLLIDSWMAGAHPRVYDLETSRLVWASNTARGAQFFPE